MIRREFVTGISAMLFASQLSRTTAHKLPCVASDADPNPQLKQSECPDYASFLAAKYPVPTLTPLRSTTLTPFKVRLTLTNSRFWGHWNDAQKARINQAASLFQAVWSSEEFRDKVTSIDSLIWHEGTEDEAKYPINITGASLYSKLVSNRSLIMPIRLIRNTRDQTAASDLEATDMEDSWANRASVYDLCNTLSHEYTHYRVTGWSWDEGHKGPGRQYVSYGIGALTENLAAGFVRSCDDPTS